jgi:GTP-binding protein EngB required for normal cell division
MRGEMPVTEPFIIPFTCSYFLIPHRFIGYLSSLLAIRQQAMAELDGPDENRAVQLDGDAFIQLESLQGALLDAIDSLRALEIGKEIPLPQLIVVGNQSCGKSSVLESISQVRFGIDDSVCTRFPTELQLRRSQTGQVKVTIKPRRPGSHTSVAVRSFLQTSFDPEKLPDLIREAEVAMGMRESVDSKIYTTRFSEYILHIEIWGLELPNLTLVDLPGVFESGNNSQTEDDKRMVDRVVKRYIKDPRSIILVVVDGSHEPSNQSGPKLAKAHDEHLNRTLGIVTRLDAADAARIKTGLACALNQYMTLKLGWHSLRNRTSDERDPPISDMARDINEEDMFSSPP